MISLFKRLALEDNIQSAGIASQQNPVEAMKLLRLKARNEVANSTSNLISNVLIRDFARDKFTQTLEIMGLDKVIEVKKRFDMFDSSFKHIQTIDEESQTIIVNTGETDEVGMQTEFD